MFGYVLQDWVTIGSASATAIIQNESDWLPFSSFQDIVFWVDVRNVTGGSATLALWTAPTKDEALFSPLTNCSVSTAAATIAVVKNILSTNPGVPLATWVRWTLTPPAAAASITFRILASANRVAA